MIKERIKLAIRKTANAVGFDIQHLSNSPRHNALGIRSMGIRTVIDVGANTGQFARYIRSILPDATILCFEPLPGPFAQLRDWAEREGRGRIHAFNLALGEHADVVEMFEHVDHSPSSSILPSTAVSHTLYPQTRRHESVEIKMDSLDEFLKRSGITLVPEVLIKLDVQGYEDRVIRGGLSIFAAARVCISEIDFDSLYDGQCSFRDVWALLDRSGFQFRGNLEQTYAPDGHAVFADSVFVRDATFGGDALFVR